MYSEHANLSMGACPLHALRAVQNELVHGFVVVAEVVVVSKPTTLKALALSHGRCLRQCREESLESGVVKVQRRLQQAWYKRTVSRKAKKIRAKNQDGTVSGQLVELLICTNEINGHAVILPCTRQYNAIC